MGTVTGQMEETRKAVLKAVAAYWRGALSFTEVTRIEAATRIGSSDFTAYARWAHRAEWDADKTEDAFPIWTVYVSVTTGEITNDHWMVVVSDYDGTILGMLNLDGLGAAQYCIFERTAMEEVPA